MINVLNPPSEIRLGYVGENEFRPIQFDVSAWLQAYPQGIVSIVFSRPDGLLYPVVENCTESPAEWKPSAADLSLQGSGYVEARIISGDVIGKSSKIPTRTESSLGSSGNPPAPPVPDWILTAAQAKKAMDDALASSQAALAAAQTAQADAESTKSESALSAASALASKLAAALSETNAKSSEVTAAQALSDLLAMLGTDIPTLTGGKIPMSQIPATATQEIYTVSSESELTGLTAQRGDLAELMETVNGESTITKTWQCLGDATVRDNWVVWGTSYAVQAGSATTADEATNATMINNHRVVTMTQEQYDPAVLDPDTIYLVG